MGRLRRRTVIALIVFLLAATLLAARCDASRSIVANARPPPAMSSGGRLFGYLPRVKLIPPSGPSQRHNSVGPEEEEEEQQQQLAYRP